MQRKDFRLKKRRTDFTVNSGNVHSKHCEKHVLAEAALGLKLLLSNVSLAARGNVGFGIYIFYLENV